MINTFKVQDTRNNEEFNVNKDQLLLFAKGIALDINTESENTDKVKVVDVESAIDVLESANIFTINLTSFKEFYIKEFKNEIDDIEENAIESWNIFVNSHSFDDFEDENVVIDTIDQWITDMEND